MEDAGFIVVMGLTGSGKSTFISRLTGQQPKEAGVGHSLASSTVDTACYRAKYDQTRIIRLIDTPGFDDTTRSNADILTPIADHLATLYRQRQRLLGIVCLHRITDVRLSGSAIRNFTILQKLCGPQNYDKIVLATTMWSDVAFSTERKEAALAREDRLHEYWDDMFQGRSRMVPHFDDDNEEEAAKRIVGFLLDRSASTFAGEQHPLQIQREIVDDGKSLYDTEAGRYVHKEFLSANMERLERERTRLQEEVDKARREEALRLRPIVSSSSSHTLGRPTKQQKQEAQSDGWRQNILPRSVMRVLGLQLWSSRPRIRTRYGYRGSNRWNRVGSMSRSTDMLKGLWGSLFTINSNDGDENSNRRRDARSTSTSDLGY